MGVQEALKEVREWVKEKEVSDKKDPIYIHCSKEFLDALLRKMYENGYKKRKPKPYYRRGRWE